MTEIQDVTPEMFQELVDFISHSRSSEDEFYWFIRQIRDNGSEINYSVNDSMRGEVSKNSMTWEPIPDEKRPCCEGIDTSKDKFASLRHCAGEEHVRNLLGTLSPERLKIEYQYILDRAYEGLTSDWEEK